MRHLDVHVLIACTLCLLSLIRDDQGLAVLWVRYGSGRADRFVSWRHRHVLYDMPCAGRAHLTGSVGVGFGFRYRRGFVIVWTEVFAGAAESLSSVSPLPIVSFGPTLTVYTRMCMCMCIACACACACKIYVSYARSLRPPLELRERLGTAGPCVASLASWLRSTVETPTLLYRLPYVLPALLSSIFIPFRAFGFASPASPRPHG